jgi:hypothetical protein
MINQVLYPMGACDPLLSPIGLSNLAFPLEFDLTIGETSSHGMCAPSSPDFLDVELPSNEAILEAMIIDFIPPPELESLQMTYQRIPWPNLSNGLYLENYA